MHIVPLHQTLCRLAANVRIDRIVFIGDPDREAAHGAPHLIQGKLERVAHVRADDACARGQRCDKADAHAVVLS